MQSFIALSVLLPILARATPLTLRSDSSNPVLTSSFTWNDNCGPTVACGPSMAGVKGQGTTAANNVTFAAGKPIVNGKGAGCGQCWHLQATADPFPTNGKTWGTPVVAIINDQCTDGGYCDQTESRPLNTGYGKQVHFDLCGETGTAPQFFGALGMGVLTGYAQQVDCSMLSDGTQGSGAGNLVPGDGGGSASATWKHAADGSPATSSVTSAATNNPSLSPWANSTAQQQSGGQSSGGQNSGGQGSGGQSSGGQGSGGSGGSNAIQAPANQGTSQSTSQGSQKNTNSQQQQQGTGQSHGSMKGLEDAAFKAASGGQQGMMQAMETYMKEALAGDAPDDDETDECEEL